MSVQIKKKYFLSFTTQCPEGSVRHGLRHSQEQSLFLRNGILSLRPSACQRFDST